MQTKFIQPSVEILNLRIDEPITTLTDLLLAGVFLYAFLQIRKLEHQGRCKKFFGYYFLVIGLGALTGGILGHAFQYRLAQEWKLVSWVLTPLSVALMVQTVLEVARPVLISMVYRAIALANVLILIPVLALTIRSVDFSLVAYYSVFGLLLLTGTLSYHIYKRSGNRGVLVLMGGIGIGFVSAIIYRMEWGFSAWFNHRDISHIVLCFSAVFVLKGAESIIRSVVSS